MELKDYISEIDGFPSKGILFKDISPLLNSPEAWKSAINQLEQRCSDFKPNIVVGIESRGFIVGSALALQMNLGFVPIRKKGKLPGKTISINYELEYGNDTLEIQEGILNCKHNIILVDDLLATGGTAQAGATLIKRTGATLVTMAFIIELTELKGRKSLDPKVPIISLINY